MRIGSGKGPTSDWHDILSERLERDDAERAAKRAPSEARGAAGAAGGLETAPPTSAAASLLPAGPPAERRTPRPEPVDPSRPSCGGMTTGGITTGWKEPTTGELPAASAVPRTPAAPPTTGMTTGIPGRAGPPRTGVTSRVGTASTRAAPSPRGATSPELVVKELTRHISAREETRALEILRGRAGSGSGMGLAAIVVLSSVAVFAGTYLWTHAVHEGGVLRLGESAVEAPEEAEAAVEHATQPAVAAAEKPPDESGPAGRGASPPAASAAEGRRAVPKRVPEPQAKPGPSSFAKATEDGRRGVMPRRPAMPGGEGGPAAALDEALKLPLKREDDDTPVFTITARAPSSSVGTKPRAARWVELGGPLFGTAAPAAEKDDRER